MPASCLLGEAAAGVGQHGVDPGLSGMNLVQHRWGMNVAVVLVELELAVRTALDRELLAVRRVFGDHTLRELDRAVHPAERRLEPPWEATVDAELAIAVVVGKPTILEHEPPVLQALPAENVSQDTLPSPLAIGCRKHTRKSAGTLRGI